jgi:mannose-6-phosphate isomerase-like protein (cupin superfamily)
MKRAHFRLGKGFQRDGSIVLIEKGDRHEIRNTGRTMLKTINIYVPPAYRRDGAELPRGRK